MSRGQHHKWLAWMTAAGLGVAAVAGLGGLFMPHKSTYFYPKVIDGSVLNLLDPNEDVQL